MDSEHDFTALRELLALKRQETQDTEINRFLIEFHRRQRAQLLVRESLAARALSWLEERTSGWKLVPSLSYASGFAALVAMTFLGFSRQVQVSPSGGGYKLSLRMPASDASFALIPTSFGKAAAPQPNPDLTFTPNGAAPSATRFVLANPRVAYDATVAF